MNKLRVLDLFSGIGGFSFGLESTGKYETAAFCESAPYQRSVLSKHWPLVPCCTDVQALDADWIKENGVGEIDIITGGFPCQDISTSGKLHGISDRTRSGLWSQIARLVCEIRPRYVLVENVANLLSGPGNKPGAWFGRVLGDLAACGYDAEWENIPAASVGAPHLRQRVWVVAYPKGSHGVAPNTKRVFAIAKRNHAKFLQARNSAFSFKQLASGQWVCGEPALCQLNDGLSYSLVKQRLTGLGNAIVPQIAALIGEAIYEASFQ